jgi:hypothetical protein
LDLQQQPIRLFKEGRQVLLRPDMAGFAHLQDGPSRRGQALRLSRFTE